MTIPKSIQGDYHHWHNFLDAEVKFSLADSEKHTKEHCARVLLFALLIAVKMDLPHEEREVLCAAAVFHDSRRQDDWLDVGHGQRAADYYRAYCRTHPLVFDERAYSAFRAARLGSFVTPASLMAFAAASYKISWLSCSRRYAALSLAFLYSSATGRVCP